MNARIISIILVSVLLLSFVGALSISGPSSSASCQCSTATQKYTVCADVAGTYSISVDSEQKNWFAFAPSSLNLAAGECGNFYVFVTPECYADFGVYNAKIIVSGIESKEIDYSLNVSQCHTFDYSITPQFTSAKPCEETTYNISVRNTGTFTDDFIFVQKGLPVSWVTYPSERIILNAGQSYSGTIKVSPSCSTDANTYSFDMILSNLKTNASSSKLLTREVTKFTPFELNELFSVSGSTVIDSCEEFDKNVVLTAKNLSTIADEFTLSLVDLNGNALSKSIAYFENTKLSLGADSNAQVSLIIKKNSPQVFSAQVKVYSKNFAKEYTAFVLFEINDCYNVVLQKDSNKESACIGSKSFSYTLQNNGTQSTDLNLEFSYDGNLVSKKSVYLEANSSQTVNFDLNSSLVSSGIVLVKAESDFVLEKHETEFSFENCYDSVVDFPSQMLVCVQGTVNEEIVLTNRGTRSQNYTLSSGVNWLYFSPAVIDINAQSSSKAVLLGTVPFEYPNQIEISAVSNAGTIRKTVDIITLSNEECNAFEVSAPLVVDANCCAGTVIPIVLKNTGYFDQELGLKVSAPEWFALSETSASILPKEETIVYAYISPSAGSDGNYNIEITAFTDSNLSDSFTMTVRVFGGACGLDNDIDLGISSSFAGTDANDMNTVILNFVIVNDSNAGFTITRIYDADSNREFLFDSNVYLLPGEKIDANFSILPLAGETKREMNIVIETTAGTLTKSVDVSLTEKEEISITGFFSAFGAPLLGSLLLILLLALILLALRPAKENKQEPEKKFSAPEEKLKGKKRK